MCENRERALQWLCKGMIGFILMLILIAVSNKIKAQNIVGAFSNYKGELSLAASYTYESFGEYYKGSEKVVLGIQDVSIHSVGIFAEYGLTDRWGIIANLPFVNTSSSNSNVSRSSDLQDLSLHVKYALINPTAGRFLMTSALGLSFPISNYDPLVPTTIGTHAVCTHISLAGLYKLGDGLFIESSNSYITKNESVPDALQSTIKIGWSRGRLYAHTFYVKQQTFGGDDLGEPGSTFQSLQVCYDKIGAYASYTFIPRLSAFVGGGSVLNGLNVGQSSFINLGVVSKLDL